MPLEIGTALGGDATIGIAAGGTNVVQATLIRSDGRVITFPALSGTS